MPTFGSITANTNIVPSRANGSATLTLGTVTINDAGVTANSIILLSPPTGGILQGITQITSLQAGVGFTITSTILADTASFKWVRFEP